MFNLIVGLFLIFEALASLVISFIRPQWMTSLASQVTRVIRVIIGVVFVFLL